jgi:hypothetical protein
MRGNIRKRGENSYSITGKYKQVYASVKGTKKDAEKRCAELIYLT